MEGLDLSFQIFIFLFIVGAVAGLVDSIAGGGGLIALPALLSVGLPPQLALGTNKLQGCFGTLSASYNFVRTGHVSLRGASQGVFFTLLGAGLGAWLVQQLSAGFIEYLIPVMLCIVFFYTLLSPRLGFEERGAKMSIFFFSLVFGISLGFYDGFFGPGTGSFWTVACMTMMGMNMTRASGYTKIMNFTSNVAALSLFIAGGNVCYSVGITMALGQILGASVGSRLAIKNGAKFIRPVFLIVVFLTITRLIYNQVSPMG